MARGLVKRESEETERKQEKGGGGAEGGLLAREVALMWPLRPQ